MDQPQLLNRGFEAAIGGSPCMGGSDDIDLADPQQIGNGSIVIHTSN